MADDRSAPPRTRYRGAQPFGDDRVSRLTFFGRDAAAQTLTDQVLANRLVVVYAKSGMGKSSLLNAGVAPRLREAGCQPLMLRVNDLHAGPVQAVRAGVRAEAERQGVEYVDGHAGSLWTFFKTVEFWRGDTLLTPVLVLDQFEELFTLQSPAARDALLAELAPLVRGVAPPLPADAPAMSDAAPALHVVLSLREEFLGMLDDAADRIPQIMDHRFRLTPLGRDDAVQAMQGPAAVADPALALAPFTLDPPFVDAVLAHLGRQGGPAGGRGQVEPFHLQLICQRVEETMARRAAAVAERRPFTMADFGGEPALAATLAQFYNRAIEAVSEPRMRAPARRLCEEYLISPEGRRLSLEALEIRKQLRLSERALQELVDSRLLRTDRRSDNLYYELGHDALVEPILATRRTQAMLYGWVAKGAGGLGVAVAVTFVVLVIAALATAEAEKVDGETLAGVLLLVVGSAGLGWASLQVLRSGSRTHRRFQWRGRRPSDDEMAAQTRFVPWPRRAAGWTLQSLGVSVLGFCAIVGVAGAVLAAAVLQGRGVLPGWASVFDDGHSGPYYAAFYANPVRESVWALLQVVALLPIGLALRRWGRRLRGLEVEAAPAGDEGRGPLLRAVWRHDGARDALAAAWLALLPMVGLLFRHCGGAGAGRLPEAWPAMLRPYDLARTCEYVAAGAADGGSHHFGVIVVLIGLTLASLLRLGSIVRRVRGWFGRA